ncbi:MAG: hypothetical protein Q7K55_04745 [Candidatus Levybacteria bacterium]|nr:hypothetical protein [Candidatus Levybacteria bacterium]
MSDINLLPEKRKSSLRYRQMVKIFRITAVASLVIVVISSAAVFFLKLRSPLPSLEKEENNIKSNINLHSSKAVKFIMVSSRLKNISEIIMKRPDFSKRITMIMEKIPEDVDVNKFEVGDGGLSISAFSNSLSSIGNMLDGFNSMVSNKELLKQVMLKNLTFDENNNGYAFSLSINFL